VDLLTVKEVAELKGCTERYIRRIIKDGKLQAQEDSNPANNIKQYLVPVSALPEDLQQKYYSKIKSDAVPIVPELKENKKNKKVNREKGLLMSIQLKSVKKSHCGLKFLKSGKK